MDGVESIHATVLYLINVVESITRQSSYIQI